MDKKLKREILKTGLTEREIAKKLKCSQQNVNLILRRALRKLKKNAHNFYLNEFWED